MTIIKAQTHRGFQCPDCQNFWFDLEWFIGPPSSRKAGPRCGNCGNGYDVTYNVPTDSFMVERKEGENAWGIVHILLKLPTDRQEIYFVVRTDFPLQAIEAEEADPGSSHMTYHFEEHTCPTNWMRVGGFHSTEGIQLMSYNGDPDPHDIFELVRAVSHATFLAKIEEIKPTLDNNQIWRAEEAAYYALFPELTTRPT